MYTKAKIYNLALGALLLTKTIADTDSDPSIENRTLNTHWESALNATLQDMDLDATSTQKLLELSVVGPNNLWKFAYKYPTNCSYLRRIQSSVLKDTRDTQVRKRIATLNGFKVILTDEEGAIAEYIPNDLNLNVLSANAGLAVAYKLAWLAASLVSGKYSLKIRQDIEKAYSKAILEAQEHDRLENSNFDEDEVMSEFVAARIS